MITRVFKYLCRDVNVLGDSCLSRQDFTKHALLDRAGCVQAVHVDRLLLARSLEPATLLQRYIAPSASAQVCSRVAWSRLMAAPIEASMPAAPRARRRRAVSPCSPSGVGLKLSTANSSPPTLASRSVSRTMAIICAAALCST